MTAPQYPAGYAPAPQQPQFPPGFPQAPTGYGSTPAQGYPQQQAPQLAEGSLDSYFTQPSTGGGAALNFDPNQGGSLTHAGIVARPITNADVQQQTQPGTGLPAFFKDGRPKFVMKVPLLVQPSTKHPDGQAQWYVAGSARDELVRAMAEAGAPEGPPEVGAAIMVTKTGTRPSGVGMNPAGVYAVKYQRPNGSAPIAAPQAAPAAAATPPGAQAGPPAPPAAPAEPPADMTPEQQALLDKLTGQSG